MDRLTLWIQDAKARQWAQVQAADAQQDPLGFLISQTAYIEPQVIDIKYPDIRYPMLLPVDTQASDWARTITYFSRNMTGQAGWYAGDANAMPLAESFKEKHDQTVEMAAIGYGYNLEELNQSMMVPGSNLRSDRAMAARRASEEFVDNIALYGDAEKGFEGLYNSTNVTKTNAPNNAAGTSSNWADKDADEIAEDINDTITGAWTGSLTVELCDTVILPPSAYAILVAKRLPDSNGMTLMQFVEKANIYTAETGQKLTIRQARGLENAAAGDRGRMVSYRRDPTVLKFHMPMPHMFLPVWQTDALRFEIPGICRIGGLEIRRPGAVRYLDNITD